MIEGGQPREVTENEDKAQAFLDSFFPEMNTPAADVPTAAPLELPRQPITELGIHRSLKAAKGTTAPGEGNLPMVVCKQLWTHLGSVTARILNTSMNLGYHPKQRRNAKIVVLRKPGKADYSIPGAYRPISLLKTLGKLLDASGPAQIFLRTSSFALQTAIVLCIVRTLRVACDWHSIERNGFKEGPARLKQHGFWAAYYEVTDH
ncbi:hypothetical protein PENSUB_1288 [Penicillium subrubescens]|jgi:hypothetical protein|uniref:Reverse transcriptase domain-containing protein n=1 Tax=Penicillium subrubescens TaxID=1316194 RepID=A0A1Q5UL30_9EURO|nr:hypothetical protein PENSUB_1288 [Penicillium subrubescens]